MTVSSLLFRSESVALIVFAQVKSADLALNPMIESLNRFVSRPVVSVMPFRRLSGARKAFLALFMGLSKWTSQSVPVVLASAGLSGR